ncbi:MAG: DndE family protein [Euryarchaeota archaeon]
MTKSIQNILLGTTLMSTVTTHNRLKKLATVFGTSEDLISRLAISYSLQQGPLPKDWQPSRLEGPMDVLTGKSIRGSTMFKDDLSLFLVMLAHHEPKAEIEDARELFIGHWERGVERLLQFHKGEDWVQLLHRLIE